MIRTVTVTEASRSFSDLINRVRHKGESALLVKGGKAIAKIIPVTDNITGKQLAALWPSFPHLGPEEAVLFEKDLSKARKAMSCMGHASPRRVRLLSASPKVR